MQSNARRAAAFLTSFAVFSADRWTKWLVESRLSAYDTVTVIPGFFNIVRSENPGIAFGMFQEGAGMHRTAILIAVSVVAVAILAWMLWRIDRQDAFTATGLSLIFGGAVGNVYDRVHAGRVTDFIDLYAGSWHWYTFNLADSAICIGACLLLLSMRSKA